MACRTKSFLMLLFIPTVFRKDKRDIMLKVIILTVFRKDKRDIMLKVIIRTFDIRILLGLKLVPIGR